MKGQSETRVGYLLKTREFVWAFKPVDSPFYGGQTRIDWLACDRLGVFWMVEVKSTTGKSINLEREVSPGQRDALTSVARSRNGVALLAVMRGTTLYIYDWGRLQALWTEKKLGNSGRPNSFALDDAPLQYQWKNKRQFQSLPFRKDVRQLLQQSESRAAPPSTLRTPTPPSPTSPKLARSPLTWKPRGFTPIRRKMLR